MTVQVTITPPGTSVIVENGGTIPVPPEGGVIYQLRQVDENGNVGPVISPTDLQTQVQGDDLVVTLPDGTVIIFENLMQAFATPEDAIEDAEPAAGPEDLEPAAGPAGGPGDGGGGGSSEAVAAYFEDGFGNTFGVAPRGNFVPVAPPGLALVDPEPILLEDLPPEILALVQQFGLLYTPGDDVGRHNEPGASFFNPDGSVNVNFARLSGSSGNPFDYNITHALGGDDDVELADAGNPNGNNLAELFGVPTAFYGGDGDDTVVGGTDNDIIVGDGLFVGAENETGGNDLPDDDSDGPVKPSSLGYGKGSKPLGLLGGDDTLDGGDGNDTLIGDGLLFKPGHGAGYIGYPNPVDPLGNPEGNRPEGPTDLLGNLFLGMVGPEGKKEVLDIEVETPRDVYMEGGDDTLTGGEDNDLAVGDGLLAVQGRPSGDYYTSMFSGHDVTMVGGDDTVEGNEGDDILIGDGLAVLPSYFFGCDFGCLCGIGEYAAIGGLPGDRVEGAGPGFGGFGGSLMMYGGADTITGGSESDIMIGDGILAVTLPPLGEFGEVPIGAGDSYGPQFQNGFYGGDDTMAGESGDDVLVGDGIIVIDASGFFSPIIEAGGGRFARGTEIVGGDDIMYGDDLPEEEGEDGGETPGASINLLGGSSDIMVGDGIVHIGLSTEFEDVRDESVGGEGFFGQPSLQIIGGDDLMYGGADGDVMIGDGIIQVGLTAVLDSYDIDFLGKGGSDSTVILGGDDYMFGGDGDDFMVGDGILAINSEFFGGIGMDPWADPDSALELLGKGGKGGYGDVAIVLGGNDLMLGGDGDDTMLGDGIFAYNDGGESLALGGHDIMIGGDGNDTMAGEGGHDLLIGDGAVVIQGLDEDDDGVGSANIVGNKLIGGDDVLYGGDDDREFFKGGKGGKGKPGTVDLSDDSSDDSSDAPLWSYYGFDDVVIGDGLVLVDVETEDDGEVTPVDQHIDTIEGGDDEIYGGTGDDILVGDGLVWVGGITVRGEDEGEVENTVRFGEQIALIGGDDEIHGDGTSELDFLFDDGGMSPRPRAAEEEGSVDEARHGGGRGYDDVIFGDLLIGVDVGLDATGGGNDRVEFAVDDSSDSAAAYIEGGNDDIYGGGGQDLIIGDGALWSNGAALLELLQNNDIGVMSAAMLVDFDSFPISYDPAGFAIIQGGDDYIVAERQRGRGGDDSTDITSDEAEVADGSDDSSDEIDDVIIGDGLVSLGAVGAKIVGGDDEVYGGRGNDIIIGDGLLADESDSTFLYGGDDELYGGSGDDIIYGDGLYYLSPGGPISTTDFAEGLDLGNLKDHQNGIGGNDIIDGGEGNDYVDGEGGDDIVDGGEGVDIVIGGTGSDTGWFAENDSSAMSTSSQSIAGVEWDGGTGTTGTSAQVGTRDLMSGNEGRFTESNGFVVVQDPGRDGDDETGDLDTLIINLSEEQLGNSDLLAELNFFEDWLSQGANDTIWFIFQNLNLAVIEWEDVRFTLQGCEDIILDEILIESSSSPSTTAFLTGDSSVNELIVGFGDDDELFGDSYESSSDPITYSDDLIVGNNGFDTLYGDVSSNIYSAQTGGDDKLIGGPGGDTLVGDANNLYGGTGGDDMLFGDDFGDGPGEGVGKSSHDEPGIDTLYGDARYDISNGGQGGNDVLDAGGGSVNTLFGDAGEDIRNESSGGDDTLFSGNGYDHLHGDAGKSLKGSSGGHDALFGGDNGDTMTGDAGYELYGGSTGGNDTLDGGEGNDRLSGDAGEDIREDSAGGDDTLTGGSGFDTISGDAGESITTGSTGGDDRIVGDQVAELELDADSLTTTGHDGDDELSSSSDIISGDALDYLEEGASGGNDEIVGDHALEVSVEIDDFGPGPFSTGYDSSVDVYGSRDTLYGDAGNSIVDESSGGNDRIVGDHQVSLFADYSSGYDWGYGPEFSGYVGAAKDYIYGDAGKHIEDGSSGGDDFLVGDSQVAIDESLLYGGGRDICYEPDPRLPVELGYADDSIYGDAGQDIVNSAGGDDTIYGDNYLTSLYGGALVGKFLGDLPGGDDLLVGDAGGDIYATTLAASGGDDLIYGQGGNDRIYGDAQGGVTGSSVADATAGDDDLYGGSGNDSIFGDAGGVLDNAAGGNDLLDGGEGNDLLVGDAGTNILDGATGGDDFIFGGDGDDQIFGDVFGSGGLGDGDIDGAESRGGDDSLFGGSGNDLIVGDSGNEGGDLQNGAVGGNDLIDGGEGDDYLIGDASEEIKSGAQGGDDTIYGGDGNDIIYGDQANVDGEDDTGQSYGGDARDPETDGTGTDDSGTGGDDTMDGGSGDDTIYGGEGNDLGIWSGTAYDADFYDGGGLFEPGNDAADGGGEWSDTLRLVLTPEQAGSQAVLTDILGFLLHVAGIDSMGAPTGTSDADPYAFSTLGLTAVEWENLEIQIGDDVHTVELSPEGALLIDGAVVTGTPDDDFFQGTSIDDLFLGLGGNDTLIGDGNDEMMSGGGNEVMMTDDHLGDDTLLGGMGDDTLLGDDATDLVAETGGDDTLLGGENDDVLVGDTGTGKEGDGKIDEEEDNDTLETAQDVDDGFALFEDPNVQDSDTIPHTTIQGTGDGTFDWYCFTVPAGGGQVYLDIDGGQQFGSNPTDFDSYLRLFDADGNLVASNDESDTDPGSDNESIFGDSFIGIELEPGVYYVKVSAFVDNPVPNGATYELHISVEGHPTTGGDDLLDGAQGGDDLLVGGEGDDDLYGDAYGDVLENSVGGDDELYGGEGGDAIYGDAGQNLGGEGTEREEEDDTDSSPDTTPAAIAAAIALITATGGNDDIFGGEGSDTLFGDAGNDIIEAVGGNDNITDESYDYDTIFGDAGNDIIRGEGGDDDIYAVGYDTIAGDAGSDMIDSQGGDDDIIVTTGPSVISGDALDDLEAGIPVEGEEPGAPGSGIAGSGSAGGDDYIVGGSSVDTIFGDAGDDMVGSVGGDDMIFGGYGNDWLYGDAGEDITNSQGGDDTVVGDENDDHIVGDAGYNMYGSQGGDDLLVGDEYDEEGLCKLKMLDSYGGGDDTISGDAGIYGGLYDSLGGDDLLVGDNYTKVYLDGSPILRAQEAEGVAPTDSYYGGGSDTLVGDGGQLYDGSVGGNDILFGDSVDEYVKGGLTPFDLAFFYGEEGYYTGFDWSDYEGGNDWMSGDAYGKLKSGAVGGDDWLYGQGGNDQMYGDAGSDLQNATGGNDALFGGDGNDTASGDGYYFYEAQGGDDLLEGGYGNDNLYGDAYQSMYGASEGGNDTLEGGYGNDYLYGDAGNEIATRGDVTAVAGDDWLRGGDGDDYLYGDAGSASVDTEDAQILLGDDDLCGQDGSDTLFGDAGSLTASYGGGEILAGDDYVDGGADYDRLYGDARDFEFYFLNEGAEGRIVGGNDTLVGGTGDDSITGDAERISVSGEVGGTAVGGNDTLIGDEGNDQLTGDFDYYFSSASVEIAFGDDSLYGGSGDDDLSGDASCMDILSMGGDDLLDGGSGDDRLFGDVRYGAITGPDGAGGDDILKGDEGDDTLFGDTGSSIREGASGGDDELFGGWGSDTLIGDAGSIFKSAVGGNDLLEGGSGNDLLFGDATGNIAGGSTGGDDELLGGSGNDVLVGDAGEDIAGGSTGGNDLLDGGDNQAGYHGDDYTTEILYGDAMRDIYDGSSGGDDTLLGRDGRDYLFGDAGETIGGGNDSLGSSGGDDTLDGGGGNDVLYGDAYNLGGADSSGDVEPTAFGGDDTLMGGEDDDVLYGDAYNVKADGVGGDDILFGGGGNDILFGDGENVDGVGGDDSLFGGAGDDTLTGNGGADLFGTSTSGGDDVITDFEAGSDILRIEDVINLDGGGLGISDLVAAGYTVADDGTNVTIDFNNGSTITLEGIGTGGIDTFAELETALGGSGNLEITA